MFGRRVLRALLLVTCGFIVGLVVVGRLRGATDATGAPSATPAQERQRPATTSPAGPSGPLSAPLPDFSRVAERTVPAVASISSTQARGTRSNDPFMRLFGDDEFFGSRAPQNSLGSGVIVGADGYILTNNHVVIGESRNSRIELANIDVSVSLNDKREFPAKVVGVDPVTDLALLKINATGLPTIPWGDSSTLKVAEWVLAIGNPYELSETVTLGIVSAVGRTNVGIASYEDFIQTDAAINPGNSGGALVNARGELVGINTAIFSQSGGYQGIGFAVPSQLARRVVSDLRQYGEVRRGSIGAVLIRPVSAPANTRGASDTRGLQVTRMSRDSSAYRGGIRPGDVIVSVNGAAVPDSGQLSRAVFDARIGSTATFGIIRDGQRLDLKVSIVSSIDK